MELTRFTDYALRVLMFLGSEPGRRSSIDELADFYSVSRHHIAKITKKLAAAGFIESTRGKNGGLVLNRAPESIRIADVVRATEPHFHLVECFDSKKSVCTIDGCCGLKGILYQARARFFATLDQYTLADAIARSGQKGLAGKTATSP